MNEKVGNQKLESIAISLDAEKAQFDPVKDGPSRLRNEAITFWVLEQFKGQIL